MSDPLYVAFIWHQHQPLYKSRNSEEGVGQYRLPWVRLHGTKDYLDLVLLLEKYPKLHQTVNLVPSLILQLEDYAAGEAIDPYLALALTPEQQFQEKQKQFIIERFFDGYHRTLIDPHPRYAQLYQQKQEEGKTWCLENWTLQDYSDLLAWHNLAWIDPLFWEDPEIASWLERGKNFTLSDRQRIFSKQRQIIAKILPQHRLMQENGQLEITTTPYTHPILPLLADTNSGRVAKPKMELPDRRFQWSEDIPHHLKKAWDMYLERFGQAPRGLWPSEQSVSPEILPYIAKEGFKWIVSDEAVLGWSLKHFFHRDEVGNVLEPELLYRPYRLKTPHGDLAIVFRDHRLSDLIGFTYAGVEPKQAAADLIGHLESIHRTYKKQQTHPETASSQPWLVTIALDGENCWEYYQKDGLPFLEALYAGLSQEQHIKLVTVSEFLNKYPAKAEIPTADLHSGSWVDGSFTTWIGDRAKNKAWDLLTEARATLAKHPEATEANNPEAWEALYAAEGSDWFWWFGEGHSSSQDAIFDRLFREHLSAIYRALNEPVPPKLNQPIEEHAISKTDRQPEGFIHPVIDGIPDKQDWERAGRIEVGGSRGTMHQASLVQRIFYGFDHLNLYFRFDFTTGVTPGQDLPEELHLFWYYPGIKLPINIAPIEGIPDRSPVNHYFHHHLTVNLVSRSIWLEEVGTDFNWYARVCRGLMAFDRCLEIAIPWADLKVEPDYCLEIVAILATDGNFHSNLPDQRTISVIVP